MPSEFGVILRLSLSNAAAFTAALIIVLFKVASEVATLKVTPAPTGITSAMSLVVNSSEITGFGSLPTRQNCT